MPHLFIAYSCDEQLLHFLQHCISTLNNNFLSGKKLSIAITLGSLNAHVFQQITCPITYTFLPYSGDHTTENSSKDVFMLRIFEEMKTRLKLQKKKKKISQKLPVLIVIIDELFNLILSQKSKRAFTFYSY